MMCFEVLRLPSKGGGGSDCELNIATCTTLFFFSPYSQTQLCTTPIGMWSVHSYFLLHASGLLALVKLSPAPHTISVIFNSCTSPTRRCTT
eukprot:jgi/Botrbrau1/11589/Bobra.247_1s0010.1